MNRERLKIVARGLVQGVGFRPFVYRLANELCLRGWVLNSAGGVFIEVEGPRSGLDTFLHRLEQDKPALAVIQSLEHSFLDPVGYNDFAIRHSEDEGPKTVLILPDIATCPDCLREINSPSDRRYRYPFTNCTHCGPRFSIIESLPYDRPNTSMKQFAMCPACEREYNDPLDRRFHAQPIACPECGPRLAYCTATGTLSAEREEALGAAIEAVRNGQILALKGLGGYQLIVDARNDDAVRRLRKRKQREEKPLALMYPSLESVNQACHVSQAEARLLQSPEAPIVLLERLDAAIAPSVAPGNPCLGVMLPYTPVHHLLLSKLGFPVVATSANLSDEPICTDNDEALERLAQIADGFLMHDRPIVRHVDDSIVRVLLGRELVLRRARGYAPLPITMKETLPPILATGAHLKNTVALSVGNEILSSQHIGDLETQAAYAAFVRTTADLPQLYAIEPQLVACDQHPDYLSTQFAQSLATPHIEIQHHHAHIAACMAENELEPPLLGVAWDGTGYGPDGTIWGGEFFSVKESCFERVAHLRTFQLPGGDAAVKEPQRCALGLLYEMLGDEAFAPDTPQPLKQMLSRGIQSPYTSSAGRLFDAVAALLDIRQQASFEGQAAMELEFSADPGIKESYPINVGEIVDWQPMIEAMRSDNAPIGVRAAKFHNTLAEAIVRVAGNVGETRVVLSGGCFQNKLLTERTVLRLREAGFRPYWHQRVPPNDGGIALGQVYAAAKMQQLNLGNVELSISGIRRSMSGSLLKCE
jgi:hydrogenase maturation protein HypF